MGNVISIGPVSRQKARTLTVFAGVSGSGKTRSAIYFAYGLAGLDPKKVGLLDTELGRGALHDRALEQDAQHKTTTRFQYGRLAAPFSPGRYVDAIRQFEDAGVEVLVIDSGSHEWEGEGGCDDIANAPGPDGKPPRLPRWNAAKREHKRFINRLLQSDLHVVLCLRAREKAKPGKDNNGKTVMIPQGIQPICEKNTMFEATISLLMHDTSARGERGFYERIKVPGEIENLFPGDAYLTSAAGSAVRDWIEGGAIVDPRIEKYRNRLLSVTEQGLRYIETAWAKVPKDVQAALGEGFFLELAASASEFDKQKELGAEPESIAEVNRQLLDQPAKVQGVHLDFN